MLEISESEKAAPIFRLLDNLPPSSFTEYLPLTAAFKNLPHMFGLRKPRDLFLTSPGFAPNTPPLVPSTRMSSAFLNNFQALFSNWDFTGSPTTVVPGENKVSHHSLRGRISANYEWTGLSGDYPATHEAFFHGHFPYVDDSYIVPTPIAEPLTISYNCDDLVTFMADIPNVDWGLVSIEANGAEYDFYLKDYVYLLRPDHIELIHIYWVEFGKPITSPTGTNLFVVRQVLSFESDGYFHGLSPVSSRCTVTYLDSFWHHGWSHMMGESYTTYEGYSSDVEQYLSISGSVTPHGTYVNNDIYFPDVVANVYPYRVSDMVGILPTYHHTSISGEDYSFLHFRKLCESLRGDLIPVVGLAANAALADSTANFGINQFENTPGLVSLFGLVDVVKLFKEAYALRRFDVGSAGSTLKNALSLLADGRLVYSYALSPTVSDIKTITGGAREFRHRYFSGGNFVNTDLRNDGPVTVDIPLELTMPFELSVAARVVVRGHYNPDSIMYKLLPLDAIGLLPRLSYLWATLPFSFVADNVINISAALDVLDSYFLNSSIFEVDYSVGSYTVEWKFSEENSPLDFQWDQLVENDLSYRSYYRDTFHGIPQIGPSRVLSSFFGSSMPSDLLTYSALATSLLL